MLRAKQASHERRKEESTVAMAEAICRVRLTLLQRWCRLRNSHADTHVHVQEGDGDDGNDAGDDDGDDGGY